MVIVDTCKTFGVPLKFASPPPPIISDHGSPHPRLRRLARVVLVFSLIVMGIVVLTQILLMILLLRSGLPGWLFGGTAIFTAILMFPLLIGSVIHPAISMTGDGLILQPLIGHAQFVRWEDLTGTAPHPLIFNDEATGRLLYGKRYRPREGLIILVAASAGLS